VWGERRAVSLLGAEAGERVDVLNVDGSAGATGSSRGVVTAAGTAGGTVTTAGTALTTTTAAEGTAGGNGLASRLGEADLDVLDQDLGLLLALAGLGNRVLGHLDEVASLLDLEDLGVLPLAVVSAGVGGAGLGEGELEGLGGLLLEVVIKGLHNNLGLDGLGSDNGSLSGPERKKRKNIEKG
jgi:hypothetical protein